MVCFIINFLKIIFKVLSLDFFYSFLKKFEKGELYEKKNAKISVKQIYFLLLYAKSGYLINLNKIQVINLSFGGFS